MLHKNKLVEEVIKERKTKMNPKGLLTFNISDYYKFYTEIEDSPLDKNTYTSIINNYFEEIMELIRTDRLEFRFPGQLGTVLLVTRKVNNNNLQIDFKHYNKTGEKVYLFNDHSNGKYALYKWYKGRDNNLFKYKKYYNFVPTRANKRTLAKYIKEKTILLNF